MPVHTIGVIGAGTMGSGIAQAAATKGFEVILIDVSEAAVGRGIGAVESHLAQNRREGQVVRVRPRGCAQAHPWHRRLRSSKIGRCRDRSGYRKLRSESENSQTDRFIS